MTENKAEFDRLVSEVRELTKYLSDLGIENLPALLPDPRSKNSEKQSAGEPTGRIPPPEITKVAAGNRKEGGTQAPDPKIPSRRPNLLGETKLSDVNDRLGPVPVEPERPVKTANAEVAASELTKPLFDDELPEKHESLAEIRADIGPDCTRCELCENRTQVVNSVGNENADLMIVGEAPGADEDLKGEPFVGRAGKLLTKILEAIGYSREDVFIGNINRCRPPQNRQPTLEESAICKPFLLREIASVRPRVIVVLGNTATKNLLNTSTGITKLRGNFAEYYGVKVMPTFHPAYLLRDPRKKREVWDDMRTVRDYLDSAEE